MRRRQQHQRVRAGRSTCPSAGRRHREARARFLMRINRRKNQPRISYLERSAIIREEKAKNNRPASVCTLVITSVGGTGFRQSAERRKLAFDRSRRLVILQPAGLLRRPAQDELDLRVEAAQIIVRPTLNGVKHGGIDSKQKRFALWHVKFPV